MTRKSINIYLSSILCFALILYAYLYSSHMIEPYHMVFINAVLAMCVVAGWSFYTFIYPKKKVNLFFLLCIISLLPVISIFRKGVYESGDFTLHLYRAIDFYNSLSEGIIMPSWASQLNAHYGYPLFLFLNPLPYYIIALFHFLGFSFVMSMKLFLDSFSILSGIFMYLFAKLIFKKSFPAFTTAIFYLFAPYHFIDLHFRVDVGEIAIYMTLPLLLYSYQLLIQKPTFSRSLFVSLSMFLLILSHQAMAFFSIILLLSYMLFTFLNKTYTKKLFYYSIFSLVSGLVISAYILLPYIAYTSFLHTFGAYGMIFTTTKDLFFTPWRFGFLFQGPRGEVGSLIGYTQLLIIPLAILQIITYKKTGSYKHTLYWIIVSVVCFGLLLPQSKIIWDTVPLIHLAILSTRLLLFISLSLAIIAGEIANKLTKKYMLVFVIFIMITIAYTILNWGNRRMIPTIDDFALNYNMPLSTSQIEGWSAAIPVWKNPREFKKVVPSKPVSISKGKGEIKTISHLSTIHDYIIYANTPLTIIDDTWYFPGWKAYVDNNPSQIQYINKKQDDLMHVQVPVGLHRLKIVYQDIPLIKTFKIITMTGLSFIIIYFVFWMLLLKKFVIKHWQ